MNWTLSRLMLYHCISKLVHKSQGHNSIHVNTNRGPSVQGVETIINICRQQQMYVSQSRLLASFLLFQMFILYMCSLTHVLVLVFAVIITPGTLRWAAA